jgi:hypothetical protein
MKKNNDKHSGKYFYRTVFLVASIMGSSSFMFLWNLQGSWFFYSWEIFLLLLFIKSLLQYLGFWRPKGEEIDETQTGTD